MNVNFRMIIFWTTIVLCVSHSTAWWWGGSNSVQDHPNYLPPAVYYQQRLLKTHPVQTGYSPSYSPGPGEQPSASIPVPAIPIQVPLEAHLAPMPQVHNVQLVPCLCPVQPEEYKKPLEMTANYNNKKDV